MRANKSLGLLDYRDELPACRLLVFYRRKILETYPPYRIFTKEQRKGPRPMSKLGYRVIG